MFSSSTRFEKSAHLSLPNHPFVMVFIEQFHLADTEGKYQDWSDEKLLNSLIVSLSGKSHFNFSGKYRPTNNLLRVQITAFYQAVASLIEEKTGKIPQVFLNLSTHGVSSALIFCGNLLVTYELLMRLSEFSFDSLESLVKTGEVLAHNASLRVQDFF
ncbi:MAG: DUF269 domain-containing protein [Microcystaceae cyanobacterium]